MTEYTDQELLKLFKSEDSKNFAFRLIINKYQERLYWHIRKIVIGHEDTDDVLQNTFVKVWNGLYRFREDSKLYTWLYRIATNESLTFLKQKKRRYFIPFVDFENHLKNTLESEEFIDGDQIKMKLQKAILTLPEKQRLVFNMKYFEDMKYDEISEIVGTSVGALKASYHHAVKKIENYLKNNVN